MGKQPQRLPLRHGIEDKLPAGRVRGYLSVPVVYPTVSQEMAKIDMATVVIYEVPDCDDLRCLIADDPRGQYKALVVKQKRMAGIQEGTWFWSPIKGNAHSGPVIMGFEDTILALAYAQDWLLARKMGKLRTEANRKAFIAAKRQEKK